MSSLDHINFLIRDFINAMEDLNQGQKTTTVSLIEKRCTSLAAARKFIRMRNLDVVIPEDLANAIPAEADIIDNHGVKINPEVSREHWSQSTPALGDCRDHSEDCTKSGDELTSTVVDTMRKVEISKFDSAYETRDHSEDRTKLGDE